MTAPDLATLRADIMSVLARLDALQGTSPNAVPVDPCDILEIDEAVQLAGRTASTVRKWVAQHRLGRRLGGRWLISRRRFIAFIQGGVS